MPFAWFGLESVGDCGVGGAQAQWDVPQAIGPIPQASNYDLVVLQDVHVIFGEDGNAVVVTELTHGDERASGDVLKDVGRLCFGGQFT